MEPIKGGFPMEKCLRTPIKEIIAGHPAVGDILEEYGIGCVPCSVGTCLLADIVEIHNLSPNEEGELMARIAAVVFPGRTVALPQPRKERAAGTRVIAYSPPLKALVGEHGNIKRFLALVPAILEGFDPASEPDRRLMLDGVDFIRSYADRFHHAKEEDILFACFDPGLDILKAMHEDHERGRAHVREVVEALELRDRDGVAAHLAGYAGVLSEHIKKEDEILYPWMDRNLSVRQVGELFARFRSVDERFAEERRKYELFIDRLEKAYAGPVSEARR
jgi:hemerythrin-like domain-containing protein